VRLISIALIILGVFLILIGINERDNNAGPMAFSLGVGLLFSGLVVQVIA